ncbi:hypothetical protein IY145_04415 [Methylosinus sp. H3A]|uniref:hypothetical protein n=1 Tax=Methylosinus sp. H3A TaxID=2785786 RepID=UPI0018C2E157|nr:hypothetical protein [Methylosinus sp. H3A]MBG0808613.1 hypothetical protein [Methylosinus sp. H3A]
MVDDFPKRLQLRDSLSLDLRIGDKSLRLLDTLGLLESHIRLALDLLMQLLLLPDVGLQTSENHFGKKRDHLATAIETFDNARFLLLQLSRLAFKTRQSSDFDTMQLLMHRENALLIFPIHRHHPDKSQAPNAEAKAVKKSSAMT